MSNKRPQGQTKVMLQLLPGSTLMKFFDNVPWSLNCITEPCLDPFNDVASRIDLFKSVSLVSAKEINVHDSSNDSFLI